MKKTLSKEDKLFRMNLVITLALFLLSTLLTVALFLISTNQAVNLATLVSLRVNDSSIVVNGNGTWYVNVTNIHPTKETGRIYIYMLENDQNKPAFSLSSIKPGESILVKLNFIERSLPYPFDKVLLSNGYGVGFHTQQAQYIETYFSSITTKINCENCPSDGVLIRLPSFSDKFDLSGVSNGYEVTNITLPVYNWINYNLSSLENVEQTRFYTNLTNFLINNSIISS